MKKLFFAVVITLSVSFLACSGGESTETIYVNNGDTTIGPASATITITTEFSEYSIENMNEEFNCFDEVFNNGLVRLCVDHIKVYVYAYGTIDPRYLIYSETFYSNQMTDNQIPIDFLLINKNLLFVIKVYSNDGTVLLEHQEGPRDISSTTPHNINIALTETPLTAVETCTKIVVLKTQVVGGIIDWQHPSWISAVKVNVYTEAVETPSGWFPLQGEGVSSPGGALVAGPPDCITNVILPSNRWQMVTVHAETADGSVAYFGIRGFPAGYIGDSNNFDVLMKPASQVAVTINNPENLPDDFNIQIKVSDTEWVSLNKKDTNISAFQKSTWENPTIVDSPSGTSWYPDKTVTAKEFRIYSGGAVYGTTSAGIGWGAGSITIDAITP